MSKSVYSLVLADDVVEAIDTLAAKQGMSRSMLVSHILAEHANLSTPEMRMKEQLEQLKETLYSENLRVFSQSTTTLTLRTAIRYKYNPALHYTVELWDGEEALGRVRVAMRSQSEIVKELFGRFFVLWDEVEDEAAGQPVPQEYRHTEEKRYTRILRRPRAPLDAEAVGNLVSDYVLLVDQCMKAFFGAAQDLQRAQMALEETYTAHMKKDPVLRQV